MARSVASSWLRVRVGLLAGALAVSSFSGCTNPNKGTGNGFGSDPPAEDGGSPAAASSSSGSGEASGSGAKSGSSGGSTSSSGSSKSSSSGASASSSGSKGSSGAGSGSASGGSQDGQQKVPSNVQYTDAGVVICGTPCPLTSNICCIDQLGNGHCMSTTSSCSNLEATFKCVQATDCPANQVCCGNANQPAATAGATCQDVASNGNQCTPAPSSTEGSAQLCQTDAECVNGAECIWQDCTVGTLKPSLTMCGLQSSAPFNCVTHQ